MRSPLDGTTISRLDLLRLGESGLAATAVVPYLSSGTATVQSPKRGGTLSLRWDPPHFDPRLTIWAMTGAGE